MNKDLNQLFLGVIIGAVGIEVLRKKQPELLEKIKESSKDLARGLESVYKEIEETIKKAADETNPHEANLLKLDCSKVHANLNWRPVWNSSTTFGNVVKWYREFYESDRVLSKEQLFEYTKEAKQKQVPWAM